MVGDPVVEDLVVAEEEVVVVEADLEVALRVLRLGLPAHLAHLALKAAQAAQEGAVAQEIPAPQGKLVTSPHTRPFLTFLL